MPRMTSPSVNSTAMVLAFAVVAFGLPVVVGAHDAHDRSAPAAEARHLPAGRLHEPVDRNAETLRGEAVGGFDLGASERR